MNNLNKTIIAVAILIAGLSVAYYFVIYVPHRDAWIKQREETQNALEQSEKCKTLADNFIKDQREQNKILTDEFFDEMQVHFNKNLNTCLLDYTDRTFISAPVNGINSDQTEIIVNLLTGENLANYWSNNKSIPANEPLFLKFLNEKQELMNQ